MKRVLAVLLLIMVCGVGLSNPATESIARHKCGEFLSRDASGHRIIGVDNIPGENANLGFVYRLSPAGYVVIAGDTDIYPVIAYSFENDYADSTINPLMDMLKADLESRLSNRSFIPEAILTRNRLAWENPQEISRDPEQQWPPAGSTATGGWIKTLWTQTAPYNNLCPINQSSGAHTYAGCPAVAMAQILNYYETINGTSFSDADDYHHNYGGSNYWFDDDHATWGFPSWTELNGYLDTAMHHYRYQEELTDMDKAALNFAAGVAAQQVYNSAGSGTFGVNQAYMAYQRFGFDGAQLYTEDGPALYTRMAGNMMDAKPVHLAVVTPAWDAGHNVVVDGYNTDNYYHLNFGWGGSYNGWYLLPQEIPYNLTVIEGAICDINPREYFFYFPGEAAFNTFEDVLDHVQIEMINVSAEPISVESLVFPSFIGGMMVNVQTTPSYPCTVASGQSIYLDVMIDLPTAPAKEILEGNIRLIHSYGAIDIPLRVNSELNSAVEDQLIPEPAQPIVAYPNPFGESLNLKTNASGVTIYNLKGQTVRRLQGQVSSWDGKDEQGIPCRDGIYLIRDKNGKAPATRILKLR